MRKQPKIIGFIGDCHPFEYGGGLVLDREWYDDDLFHVADFTGSTVSDLVDRVCSEDPMERASFYYDLASYHGWANVGHGDTESWRRMELKKVYAHRFAMARRRKYNRLDIWV